METPRLLTLAAVIAAGPLDAQPPGAAMSLDNIRSAVRLGPADRRR